MFHSRYIVLALAALVLGGCEIAAFDFPWQRDRLVSSPASAAPPSGDKWTLEENGGDEQREQDVAECHASARAQVERDMRIDDNIQGGQGMREDAMNFQEWQSRVDAYGYRERQMRLFERCMRDRGYER